MAEYIDRDIAIEKITDMFAKMPDSIGLYFAGKCIGALANTPAADVVEIVRCMYCKRSEKRNGNRYCTYWQDTVDPMHYCGKGDRREPLQK